MGFECIKCLVLDVDGTMTDGGIYYDETGNEWKKFCTRDAAGIFAARSAGIRIVVVTGRYSQATERRMKELQVDEVYQSVKDKAGFLRDFMKMNEYDQHSLGYIGDDLNDLPSMMLAGYVGCPKDACKEVKAAADFVSSIKGGHGAVRDIVEHEMELAGMWSTAIQSVYRIGV